MRSFGAVAAFAALAAGTGACGIPGASPPAVAPVPAAAVAPPSGEAALEVPAVIPKALRERRVIARGLRNPRGIFPLESALLVAEAGTGSAADGQLVRLEDHGGDAAYLDAGERRVVFDKQPSKNLISIVRRDEVFGLAGIDQGAGDVLVALAFFGGPSTIFKVDGDKVTQWGSTHGNINDLAFDPGRRQWFGVASTTDEVVRLTPGGGTERIVKIPPLANGQDAVPADITHDPRSGELLVSLFTGSPEGEEGGTGVEIHPRAGGIIAVHPETKSYRWIVKGLTVPTDLEVGPDGAIYVLEFCDAFLEPAETVADLLKHPSHGGFRRFSGRLLRIDREAGKVVVVAEGLDAPTNLVIRNGQAYVSEGMGTPGREIPGPGGTVKLDGFIERIAVTP